MAHTTAAITTGIETAIRFLIARLPRREASVCLLRSRGRLEIAASLRVKEWPAQAMPSNGSAWRHKSHARESGHPDLAAHAGALDSRLRGKDSVNDLILNERPTGLAIPRPYARARIGRLDRALGRADGRSLDLTVVARELRLYFFFFFFFFFFCHRPTAPPRRDALLRRNQHAFRFPAATTLLNINIVLFLKLFLRSNNNSF